MAKKGEIAVVQTTETTTFVIGSGRPSEKRLRLRLVKVNSSTNDGIVKSFQSRSGSVSQLKYESRSAVVLTIPADRQDCAARLFKSRSWDQCEWDSADALKADLLAA